MLLGPRVRDGTHGYHVITPLVRTDGSTVLVDRGFIGKDFADHYERDEEDEVQVLGMLRTSHMRNSFTPDNHPAEGKWYWADIDRKSTRLNSSHSDPTKFLPKSGIH